MGISCVVSCNPTNGGGLLRENKQRQYTGIISSDSIACPILPFLSYLIIGHVWPHPLPKLSEKLSDHIAVFNYNTPTTYFNGCYGQTLGEMKSKRQRLQISFSEFIHLIATSVQGPDQALICFWYKLLANERSERDTLRSVQLRIVILYNIVRMSFLPFDP